MLDSLKLKGKIIEKGFTIEKVAENIGMNKSTMSRKLNNNSDFTIKQADALVKLLDLNLDEAMSIFFNQFIA